MVWLATGTCEAAYHFGWAVGTLIGALAAITIIFLVLSSPAYRRGIQPAVNPRVRIVFQWIFILVPYLLALICIAGGWRVGSIDLGCYLTTLSLGLLAVIGPIMLLLMFTTAHVVGRAAAR